MVTPEGIFSGGVAIEAGKIAAISHISHLPEADETIDAHGRFVIPGVVDPHSHLGSGLPKDTLRRYLSELRHETASAAYGGVTTFFTKLEGQGLWFPFEQIVEAINSQAVVDMALHIGVGTKEHLRELPEWAKLGISSFKFSLAEYPEFGVAEARDGIIFDGLRIIRAMGYPALPMFHCENEAIIGTIREELIKNGQDDLAAWSESRPWYSEEEPIRRVLLWAKVNDAPAYIVHVTSKQGLAAVHEAKAQGVKAILETQAHHLTFTKHTEKGNLAKGNPPLREAEDVEALWKGLASGLIDCVGSDHINTKAEEKIGQTIWNANSGWGPEAETLLPVMLSEGVNKGRISIERLVSIACSNPAKAFGVYPEKGTIQVGGDADLVVVDMEREVTFRSDMLHSVSNFSIYDGWKFKGWPVTTICKGRVVVNDGQMLGKPGSGRYIPRVPTGHDWKNPCSFLS